MNKATEKGQSTPPRFFCDAGELGSRSANRSHDPQGHCPRGRGGRSRRLEYAEIIRYVKRFYNSDSIPVSDHWDLLEKRPRPPAPYLLQGIRHPSTAGIQTIRSRIRELSILAEARSSDRSPLVLLPHDCRRVFASEHLNNNTPVHIIQALLGHASPDTVMIYAKLYPSRLVEEYRQDSPRTVQRALR